MSMPQDLNHRLFQHGVTIVPLHYKQVDRVIASIEIDGLKQLKHVNVNQSINQSQHPKTRV